jgi:hypothetical protein
MTPHVDVQALRDDDLDHAACAVYIAQGIAARTGRDWARAVAADKHYAIKYAKAALGAVRSTPTHIDGVESEQADHSADAGKMVAAVEQLIADGWAWTDGKWVMPVAQDAVALMSIPGDGPTIQPLEGWDRLPPGNHRLFTGVPAAVPDADIALCVRDAESAATNEQLDVPDYARRIHAWLAKDQHSPAAAVPDGWALVPVEPTPEQRLASKRYKLACNKRHVSPTGPGFWRAMMGPLLAAKEPK